MNLKKIAALLMLLVMALTMTVSAETVLEPLPMDTVTAGPKPKTENYLSDTEYVDESISVKIYEGRYADTDYVYAHVKISHPSQLRTAPASMANDKNKRPSFKDKSTGRGRLVANAVNAVISINGDYYTKDECKLALVLGVVVAIDGNNCIHRIGHQTTAAGRLVLEAGPLVLVIGHGSRRRTQLGRMADLHMGVDIIGIRITALVDLHGDGLIHIFGI